MPALLTRMSMRPYFASTSLTIFCQSLSLVTSRRMPSMLAPNFSFGSARSPTTTFAPSFTNKSTTARPMPWLPPVIKATLPSSLISILLWTRYRWDIPSHHHGQGREAAPAHPIRLPSGFLRKGGGHDGHSSVRKNHFRNRDRLWQPRQNHLYASI